jgi:dGTPase
MPADANSRPLDSRTDAQRDRDRVLYAGAFARLAEITQVTSPEHGYVFHNRLTHSLKVGQIARRIAERLNASSLEVQTSGSADPDAAEAAGLAHDLGHPPFGHIAEDELNRLVGDRYGGFEGNAQTFRIVTELATSDAQNESESEIESVPGLNLTRQTLDGILKYPWAHKENPERAEKWGHYASEADVFGWVREGRASRRRSLIAEIMDWADDLTFAVHDLLDFFCAGRIPIERCKSATSQELKRILDGMFSRRPKWQTRRNDYETALDTILDLFPFDPDARFTDSKQDREELFKFATVLIRDGVNVMNVRQDGPAWVVEIDPSQEHRIEVLKQFTWEYVILDHDLAAPQQGQRKAVQTVFERLLDAADRRDIHLFPPRYRDRIRAAESGEMRVRTVADSIAGMTEREILRFYSRLQGFGL